MFENENILRMARYCLASLMMLRTTRHPKRMYAVTIYHIFINKYLTPIPYTSSSDIIKKIIEKKGQLQLLDTKPSKQTYSIPVQQG